jgi:hypothetical protein
MKEIAVKQEEMALAVVAPINFEELNDSIKKLGEASNLTEKDREVGVRLLGEWQENVLDKLRNKEYEVEKLLQCIEDTTNYGDNQSHEIEEKLTVVAGWATGKAYTAYLQAEEDLSLGKMKKPEYPGRDPEMTIVQLDMQLADYKLVESKYEIAQKKLQFVVDKTYRAWRVEMRKAPKVKALRTAMTDYKVKLQKHKTECIDKAHMAKLSIALSDKDAREALKEMVKWAEKINK